MPPPSKESFTGVLTVDVGDERRFERCRRLRAPGAAGAQHRADPVRDRQRQQDVHGAGRAPTGRGRRAVPRHAGSAASSGADLPLIDDDVTVEQLLTHTSGIGDYIDEEADWDAADYVLPVPVHVLAETEAFVPVVDGYPQAFPPGERFTYCNGGYIVLALIAERASGVEYHDLVEAEVCARAGLGKTSFLRSDDLPGDAALGYLFEEGDRTNVLHLPVRGNGDGGIYTTADDLHTFWRALTDGRIVNEETVEEMTRPRYDVPEEGMRYGMGVYLGATGPQLVMEGYDAGVSFRSIHNPSTATTLSVLGNSSEGAWPVIHLVTGSV